MGSVEVEFNILELFDLWQKVFPEPTTFSSLYDLENYFTSLDNKKYYLHKAENGKLLGFLCSFHREGRRFFVILIDDLLQGQGVGTSLMKSMMSHEPELYGWVSVREDYRRLDGQAYLSPLSFYEKLGFKLCREKMKKGELETHLIHWVESKG